MTKAKTDFTQLSDRNLRMRIASAFQRIHILTAEIGRRENLEKYGTATPVLRKFNVDVDASAYFVVEATDEADAETVVLANVGLSWNNSNVCLRINTLNLG